MEWNNAWFILEEGLTEEEKNSFQENSPSLEENKENEFPEELPILPLEAK